MRKKLAILFAFAVVNIGVASTPLQAAWYATICLDPDGDVRGCCADCSYWCGC